MNDVPPRYLFLFFLLKPALHHAQAGMSEKRSALRMLFFKTTRQLQPIVLVDTNWQCFNLSAKMGITPIEMMTIPLWARKIKNPDESTGPLARPFACTAHSFACSTLLASLARSAALTCLLVRSLCSLPRSWDSA